MSSKKLKSWPGQEFKSPKQFVRNVALNRLLATWTNLLGCSCFLKFPSSLENSRKNTNVISLCLPHSTTPALLQTSIYHWKILWDTSCMRNFKSSCAVALLWQVGVGMSACKSTCSAAASWNGSHRDLQSSWRINTLVQDARIIRAMEIASAQSHRRSRRSPLAFCPGFRAGNGITTNTASTALADRQGLLLLTEGCCWTASCKQTRVSDLDSVN